MTIWTAEVLREAERIVEDAGPQSEEGRAAELEEWGVGPMILDTVTELDCCGLYPDEHCDQCGYCPGWHAVDCDNGPSRVLSGSVTQLMAAERRKD